MRHPKRVSDEENPVAQWVLTGRKSKEGMKILADKNTDTGNVFDLPKILAREEKARMEYEAREAWLMDHRTRMKSAFEKGMAEGEARAEARGEAKAKYEIFQALLRGGMPPEQIAGLMGMDVKDLAAIQGHAATGIAEPRGEWTEADEASEKSL